MDDNYSDTSAEPASDTSDTEPDQEDEDTQNTALLPKSILAGKHFDVGEEVVLKIEHIYSDEIEVSYAKEKGSKEPPTDDVSMKA